jgi:acyl-coenzyme A synthetase/AMP-(fatty) acid ligase
MKRIWRNQKARENLINEINQLISDQIGPAKLDRIQFVSELPKTRSKNNAAYFT